MALTLPGAWGLFSQMQEALCHVKGKRVTLSPGVHDALDDFKWLARMWPSSPLKCMSLSRSAQPWTATTTPPDTCAEAWCSHDPLPHLKNYRYSLALRGPPLTPRGHTT